MEVLLKSLVSLAIAGAGVYVLINSKKLAKLLQDFYVNHATKVQKEGGWNAYLFVYNPEIWKTPFATFMFRFGAIFLGIWLLLVAYPIMFGAFTF